VTATDFALGGTAIAVSKPRRGTVCVEVPATTRHDLVSVEPFQLA
jgi:hypothetical protein